MADDTTQQLTLSPKQAWAWHHFLENPAITRILFDGGARSTKTILILCWLIKEANDVPGARILIARKYLEHAKTTIFDLSLRQIIGQARGFRFYEGDKEVHCDNGSMLRVAGFDDADRVDKIMGDEYLHVFVNEATQITWDTLEKVKSRLSQQAKGARFRKLILDCNPKGPRHWLYQAGVRKIVPGRSDRNEPLPDAEQWGRLHWTPYDNPFLPPDTLKTLESLTGVQRRRLLRGEWCENEGAVYDEFDEDLHIIRGPMPPGLPAWRKLRAIDFGFTNPFCRLCGALDGDGRLYIYRERYMTQVIVQEHAKAIKAADAVDRFIVTVADHDAEDRATLHAGGIMTLAARKDIRPGIAAVKARLRKAGDGRPRLFVHESCMNTITEFAEYSWPAGVDGKSNKEVPVDDNNHAMDALRYMVMHVDNPNRSGVASNW